MEITAQASPPMEPTLKRRLMWDLCSGLGGASQAFKNAGWEVVTVDVDPIFKPTLLWDILDFRPKGERRPDFVWSSPVCTEYALRRFDKTITPSLNLVIQCRRVIRDLNPKLWALENVKNSVPYISAVLGEHRLTVGPFFLWGDFPKFIARPCASKGSPNGPHWLRSATRSKIPLSLSEDMEQAVSYLLDQQEPGYDREQGPRAWSAQEPGSAARIEPAQEPARRRQQEPGQEPSDVAGQEPQGQRIGRGVGFINTYISQRGSHRR